MNKKPFFPVTLYILLLWILTNFISIIIAAIIESIMHGKLPLWNNEIGYSIYGLIFSFPAFILLGLIIKFITQNKLILIIISTLLTFLSFYVYKFNFDLSDPEDYVLPGTYSIVLSSLILIFKIKK